MKDRGARGSSRSDVKLDELWTRALDRAERELGVNCVTQWIRPLRLRSIESDLAVLSASTGFLADWVERNYGLHLLRILQSLAPGLRRITLTVSEADFAIVVAALKAAKAAWIAAGKPGGASSKKRMRV